MGNDKCRCERKVTKGQNVCQNDTFGILLHVVVKMVKRKEVLLIIQ